MKYLFYVAVGIAILFTLELLAILIADFLRELAEKKRGPIKIKMVKTGNRDFYLRTIHDVRGISSFPELRGQIYVFREITQSFVSKILEYQLDDYFVMQKRLQIDINSFCGNLKQFGSFLQVIEYDNIDTDDETTTNAKLAAKKLLEKQRPIVNYFINLNKEIDRIISSHF